MGRFSASAAQQAAIAIKKRGGKVKPKKKTAKKTAKKKKTAKRTS
jgi:hypothetical protein